MSPEFISAVVTRKEGVSKDYDWGTFVTHFKGTTISMKDVMVGVALIKPGWEIHPPHQHMDEEYLMVTEGSGEWIVNGVTTKASEGDIFYAAPWEWHGIKNTGETTLTFYIMKWLGAGVDYPDNLYPEETK